MAESSYRRDIVAIGASSGGIEALTAIVVATPRHLPASLFIVLHVPSQSTADHAQEQSGTVG
jgi:two-component system chemotaxis response regulator CheB